MEYTELADYSLPAGKLTTWEPVADAAAWRDDARRLSFMHQEHVLRAVAAGADWHGQWIGTAFEIAEPFDSHALGVAIVGWYRRHEAFRSSVRRNAAPAEDEITRVTVPAEAVMVVDRVVGHALPADVVRGAVTEHFDTTISPMQWPHCRVVTVEPAEPVEVGQRFVVVFAADHTVMDAYTQVFAIREFTALYHAARTGEPDGLADYGSYLDFSDAERRLADQLDANNSAVVTWREFFTTTTPTQPDPMPAFPGFATAPDEPRAVTANRVPAPGRQASLSQWLLNASDTAIFGEICRACGVSMTVGIYTALSMATAALTGHGELRFISPVHTRNAARWGEAAGWFVGIVPVVLRPGDARTFREALAPVAASASDYRNVGSAPYAPIADLIGGDTTPPGFVVSYIDLRKAQGAAEWGPRNARVLRSESPDADEVYLWINRIPEGTNVSARYPSGAGAVAIEVFLSTFLAVLQRVVTDGDCVYRFARLGAARGSERR